VVTRCSFHRCCWYKNVDILIRNVHVHRKLIGLDKNTEIMQWQIILQQWYLLFLWLRNGYSVFLIINMHSLQRDDKVVSWYLCVNHFCKSLCQLVYSPHNTQIYFFWSVVFLIYTHYSYNCIGYRILSRDLYCSASHRKRIERTS
jgi:NADH:ubiquinone oxidoreductase subunit 5 (subunit L)/multisubunit Na+/H+ antiporter MnhA subunit